MSLECLNGCVSGNSEAPVALPEVALVLALIDQTGTHEITGTAPDQQPRDRLRVTVNRF
jgi:hypothetical protein